jgi:hypothetical protein
LLKVALNTIYQTKPNLKSTEIQNLTIHSSNQNVYSCMLSSYLSAYITFYGEKTTDLSQVTDKLYHSHNVVHLALSGSRTHNMSGDRNHLHGYL